MYHLTRLASNIKSHMANELRSQRLMRIQLIYVVVFILNARMHAWISPILAHDRAMFLGRWTLQRMWSRRVGSIKCLAEWHCSLCWRSRSRRGYIWRNHSWHGNIRRLDVITHLLHVLHDDVERDPGETLWPHSCHCKHTSGQWDLNRLSSWVYQWRQTSIIDRSD